MAIAAASSLPLGPHCHLCHAEGVCCSTSHGITNSWLRPSFDVGRVPDPVGLSFRCKNPFLGSTQFHWLSMGHDLCLSKVSVAADYPDSSSYMSNHAYHPLEEVKDSRRIRETKLTSAEIARSTVEANSCAWLVFPGTVHCEPHEQISWGEFQYVIDDYGDIFFEIFDDTNILEDRGASNPVNALFGMEIPIYENRRNTGEYNISEIGNSNETLFEDDYFEAVGSEVSDVSVDWGMPDASTLVHPIYFSKCLTKAANMEYNKTMDYPSNGVSIVGCLRPAYADEESYIRTLFHCVDSDGYNSDWKDGEILSLSSESDQGNTGPMLYRLEIMRIELFSVYGVQSEISLQDFQDAEPDVLVHSTPAIVERFSEKGISCNVALKALCKKKGLDIENCKGSQIVTALRLHLRVMDSGKGRSKPPIVNPLKLKPKKTSLTRWMGIGSFLVFQELSTAHRENQPTQELYTIMRIINSNFTPGRGAHLIGVDSLGMDVRVFSGVEVQTHRFPFKVRATSEAAAEKQIQQLLFPRARRKKLRTLGVGVRDADPI